MTTKIRLLNGSNKSSDKGIQSAASYMLSAGIKLGYLNECVVGSGQVGTGEVFVEVVRDNVTPSETFLVPVEITEAITVNTVDDGYVIVEIPENAVNIGSGNAVSGNGIATISHVPSSPPNPADLPTKNYQVLATINSGTIVQADFARIKNSAFDPVSGYVVATGTGSAIELSIDGVTEYTDGLEVKFKTIAANTTSPVTINVNGLGPIELKKTGSVDLQVGDLEANQFVIGVYDIVDDVFEMVSHRAQEQEILTKASIAEAEAGVNNDNYMTPYLTLKAMENYIQTGRTTDLALTDIVENQVLIAANGGVQPYLAKIESTQQFDSLVPDFNSYVLKWISTTESGQRYYYMWGHNLSAGTDKGRCIKFQPNGTVVANLPAGNGSGSGGDILPLDSGHRTYAYTGLDITLTTATPFTESSDYNLGYSFIEKVNDTYAGIFYKRDDETAIAVKLNRISDGAWISTQDIPTDNTCDRVVNAIRLTDELTLVAYASGTNLYVKILKLTGSTYTYGAEELAVGCNTMFNTVARICGLLPVDNDRFIVTGNNNGSGGGTMGLFSYDPVTLDITGLDYINISSMANGYARVSKNHVTTRDGNTYIIKNDNTFDLYISGTAKSYFQPEANLGIDFRYSGGNGYVLIHALDTVDCYKIVGVSNEQVDEGDPISYTGYGFIDVPNLEVANTYEVLDGGGYQPTNAVSPTLEQAQFFLGVAVTNSVLKFK